MVCPKCGTQNSTEHTICRKCLHLLQPSPSATRTQHAPIFQTPLRQAGEPNIKVRPDTENPGAGENSADHPTGFYSRYQTNPEINSGETAVNKPARKTGLILGISSIVLLVAAAFAFVFSGKSSTGNDSDFFSAAEKVYNSGNYTQAMIAYQKFIVDFPESPLSPIARERITQIHTHIKSQEKQSLTPRIAALLESANIAFERKRYSLPETDNAVLYTSEILRLDPANSDALALQARIVAFYTEKAEDAARQRRYRTALSNYKIVNSILPGDQETKGKILALETHLGIQ